MDQCLKKQKLKMYKNLEFTEAESLYLISTALGKNYLESFIFIISYSFAPKVSDVK